MASGFGGFGGFGGSGGSGAGTSSFVSRTDIPASPSSGSIAQSSALVSGVNRVVSGDLQRFGDHHRVTLRLVDTEKLDVLASAAIEFHLADARALIDELPPRLEEMFRVNLAHRDELATALPNVAAAVGPYLRGSGLLDTDPERGVVELKTSSELDPLFYRGRTQLARALLKAGSVDSTLEVLDALRRAGHAGALENEVLGDAYLANGEADSAVAAYERAFATDPLSAFGGDNPGSWPVSDVVATGSQVTFDAGNVNATVIGDTHYLSFYSGKDPDTAVLVSALPAPSTN